MGDDDKDSVRWSGAYVQGNYSNTLGHQWFLEAGTGLDINLGNPLRLKVEAGIVPIRRSEYTLIDSGDRPLGATLQERDSTIASLKSRGYSFSDTSPYATRNSNGGLINEGSTLLDHVFTLKIPRIELELSWIKDTLSSGVSFATGIMWLQETHSDATGEITFAPTVAKQDVPCTSKIPGVCQDPQTQTYAPVKISKAGHRETNPRGFLNVDVNLLTWRALSWLDWRILNAGYEAIFLGKETMNGVTAGTGVRFHLPEEKELPSSPTPVPVQISISTTGSTNVKKGEEVSLSITSDTAGEGTVRVVVDTATSLEVARVSFTIGSNETGSAKVLFIPTGSLDIPEGETKSFSVVIAEFTPRAADGNKTFESAAAGRASFTVKAQEALKLEVTSAPSVEFGKTAIFQVKANRAEKVTFEVFEGNTSTGVKGEENIGEANKETPVKIATTNLKGGKIYTVKFTMENKTVEAKLTVGKEVIRLTSSDVNFRSGKYNLERNAKRNVDSLAVEPIKAKINSLGDDETLLVLVEGHTDSRGNDRTNERLSKNRAKEVGRYILSQIPAESRGKVEIYFIGRGPDNPIDNNDTSEGREANRRVEISFPDADAIPEGSEVVKLGGGGGGGKRTTTGTVTPPPSTEPRRPPARPLPPPTRKQ